MTASRAAAERRPDAESRPPDPSSSVLVFAYGSNLDPDRMAARAPSARALGTVELAGHQLRFHKRGSRDGTGKANAFRTGDRADVVHGVLYALEATELAALDAHEAGYERVMRLFGIGDRAVEAWVYLARADAIDDALRPMPWYLEHVRRGARAHGLPASLLATLDAVETTDG